LEKKLQIEKANDNAVNTGLIRSIYDVSSTSNDSGSPMILSSMSLSAESVRSPPVGFPCQIVCPLLLLCVQGRSPHSVKEQLSEDTEEDKEIADGLRVTHHNNISSSRSFLQPREFHVGH
jgi:hypothetical protein